MAEHPRRFGSYVAVACSALALGVGATLVGLRWAPSLRPSSASASSASASSARPNDLGSSDEAPVNPEEGGVFISPARQQLIGVRTALVERRRLSQAIRTVGTLAYDETRLTQVHTKIAGWIEQLFVDFTGKPVQKGQPLFTIYSPDLLATQREYLLARTAQDRLAASQFQDTREGAASLLAAARKRLELWDMTPEQIAALDRGGDAQRTVTVYAPAGGVVLERNAFAGQYITPDTAAFKLADASELWAIGQIVESDLPQVHVGQAVTVDLTNEPGRRPLQGRISFIYPDVDPATRRARVRVDLPNPGLTLKADMFVTLTIQAPEGDELAVPAEAVIDTGETQYVIVDKGRGYFEPRVIRAGAPASGYYAVLDGLTAGDRVVTSAQFLIDSETNLQAAMQAMTATADSHAADNAPADHAPHAGATNAPQRVSVDFRTNPAAARVGNNAFEVRVSDADGRAVTDADVAVVFFMAAMPSMGMPAARITTKLEHTANGIYCGTGRVPAPGRWDVTITVMRGGASVATTHLPVMVQ